MTNQLFCRLYFDNSNAWEHCIYLKWRVINIPPKKIKLSIREFLQEKLDFEIEELFDWSDMIKVAAREEMKG